MSIINSTTKLLTIKNYFLDEPKIERLLKNFTKKFDTDVNNRNIFIERLRLRMLTYSLAMALLIPSWLVLAKIECTSIQPVLRNWKQGLTAYCPNIYAVSNT